MISVSHGLTFPPPDLRWVSIIAAIHPLCIAVLPAEYLKIPSISIRILPAQRVLSCYVCLVAVFLRRDKIKCDQLRIELHPSLKGTKSVRPANVSIPRIGIQINSAALSIRGNQLE
jgi:hypothetical protein